MDYATHCRAVAAIVTGISPGAAAHSVGASRAATPTQ